MRLLLQSRAVEGATLGTLTLGIGGPHFSTIELPYRDNQHDISCVPAGDYELVLYISPTHGQVWRLHNPALNVYGRGFVPEGGRSEIEIHAANFARELLGCIAVGLSALPMVDPVAHVIVPAVQDSQKALAQLRELLGTNEEETLTIERAGLQLAP